MKSSPLNLIEEMEGTDQQAHQVLDSPKLKHRKTSKDIQISDFNEIITTSQNFQMSHPRRGSMTSRKFAPKKPSTLPYSLFGNIIVTEQTDSKIISKNESFLLGDDFFFKPNKSNNISKLLEGSFEPKSLLGYNSPISEEEPRKKSGDSSQKERVALIEKLVHIYDKNTR